jgi:hypothetical protein
MPVRNVTYVSGRSSPVFMRLFFSPGELQCRSEDYFPQLFPNLSVVAVSADFSDISGANTSFSSNRCGLQSDGDVSALHGRS